MFKKKKDSWDVFFSLMYRLTGKQMSWFATFFFCLSIINCLVLTLIIEHWVTLASLNRKTFSKGLWWLSEPLKKAWLQSDTSPPYSPRGTTWQPPSQLPWRSQMPLHRRVYHILMGFLFPSVHICVYVYVWVLLLENKYWKWIYYSFNSRRQKKHK